MAFSFLYSPLLLVVCGLLAAAGAYWSYRGTVPALSSGRRALLATLRFLAFFLILFLLFQPVMRRTKRTVEPPVVAVLVDDSESLSLSAAGGDTSSAAGARAMREALDRIDIPEDVVMRAFRFDGNVNPLPERRDRWTDSLRWSGQRTDISGALNAVRERLRGENLSAVLLISDGRYNTGRSPLYTAEAFPVPIHTMVVGDTTDQRDVLLGRVTANRIAYLGAEQPVEVEVLANGFSGSRLSIELFSGGALLGSEAVTAGGETVQIPISMTYTPDREGLHNMTIRVSELDGELTHRNNRTSFPVRVLEQKRQVLLVAAAPGPDVAAVRQILSDDPKVELSVFVQKGPGTFYQGGFPEDMGRFDAILLVGYPGAASEAGQIARIRSAIDAGLPALYILTRDADLGRLSGELGQTLPATVSQFRNGWIEAVVVPTPIGKQHPMLSVPGVGPEDWQRLPPLLVSDSRWQASPDARVLATTEVRGVALDDPLVVVRSRSGVRTAAILGAGTWRWKNVPADLAAWEHLWPQVLGNALQWITAAQDQRPVRVRPVHDVFAGGEPIGFVGEVYDESLQPLSNAVVELEVTSEDGRTSPFRLESVGNGRYALPDARLTQGTYEYRAVARLDEQELGTDTGTFAVGELALEHRQTSADPALMRQIAARSGGHVIRAPDENPGAPLSGATLEPRVSSVETESNLWRQPLFLAAIVLLLTAEWVLRKRSGLV